MSVTQISVFLESRPGHLARILESFVSGSVNVRGYSCSDTGDYGIARFIVDDPEKALAILEEAGCAATQSRILVAKLVDEPGNLARLMKVFADLKINVPYSYSLISTYIAVKVDDIESAESLLSQQPVELIDQSDIARLVLEA